MKEKKEKIKKEKVKKEKPVKENKEKKPSLFARFKAAMKKTRDAIAYKLNELFTGGVLKKGFYEELEEALYSSDIGVSTTERLLEDLKKVLDKKYIRKPEDVKAELKILMQAILDENPLPRPPVPLIILVTGVNGVGKTTAIGKLAYRFTKAGKSVTVAAADTFRAAASDQLTIWAERANARIIKHESGGDPGAVVFDALASFKAKETDILLIDTAGRLHNKKNLMDELKKIMRIIEREMGDDASVVNFLVLDATTGQNALQQVEIFNEAIEVDGIILTKLDGTAKGGVVLAIGNEKKIPVVYIGIGEAIEDIEIFNSEQFVDSIID